MTLELFIKTINRLRDINDRLNKADELLRSNWTESVVGDLFDVASDALIPGAQSDDVFEEFWSIIFEDGATDEDIENLWNMYKESLD